MGLLNRLLVGPLGGLRMLDDLLDLLKLFFVL
jgi:hypothetical protein